MTFELRMAWREIRPAIKRFLFMVAAIALGVGSLTGIKGFSQALDRAMARSARDLIAADLAVRMSSRPNTREQQVLDRLASLGADRTVATETLSMASAGEGRQPVLSTVKAVDPAFYPFYGSLKLSVSQPLRDVLRSDTAVATQEFLIRTGTDLGSEVQIGAARFRIAAVLQSEPDRIASGVELGPRIMIDRAGLERTGLIQFGSRVVDTHLYRLPPSLTLETARGILAAGLQGRARISHYRDPNPNLSRGLERMANFLSLVGLLALLVGGIGVATTIHAYLQQKLDGIAVMKCLGGRSWQIIRIYVIQGLLIGLVGSALGVLVGYGVQLVFPPLLRGVLELPTSIEPAPGASLQGFLVGIMTTALFLLPPLLAIRKIRPIRVFLREMPETPYSTLRRLRHDPLPLAASVILLAGAGILASWVAESWTRGFGFMAGLAGAIAVLIGAAKLLMLGLKRIPRPSSLPLRHGLKNLYRPGGQVAAVLVALGIGVAFTQTIYLIQTSLLSQIMKSAPSDYPNLFLLSITEKDRAPVWDFLKRHPGVIDEGDPIPSIPARLQKINGMTGTEMELDPQDRRFFFIEFILTWSAEVPPSTRIVEGEWWAPPYTEPMISVGQFAARRLNIPLGSTLEFSSSGKTIRGKVASIRDSDFDRPGTNNQFIFSPGALDGLPASYIGAVRVEPGRMVGLQKSLFEKFPNVTSLDVGNVFSRIQDLLDKIASVIRFIAFFAILAGVTILASSVASTRYQRIREAVILKTLGATRAQVSRIHAAEFLIVGLVAGLIGCLLAAVAADYLLGRLLETEFDFQWPPMIVATLATAALAVVTGWLASRGVLNHKPLEILREN